MFQRGLNLDNLIQKMIYKHLRHCGMTIGLKSDNDRKIM